MRCKWYLVIVIVIVFILLFNSNVYAESCDSTDIQRLRVVADDVDISYDYLDNYYEDGFLVNGVFKITINNISDELYIVESNDNLDLRNYSINDGSIAIEKMYTGDKNFKIYSKECGKLLKSIRIKLPYYNSLYEDDVCKDYKDKIDECSKLTDSVYTYSDVYTAVNKNNVITDDNNDEKRTNFFNSKLFYTICGGVLLFIVIFVILIINRRRKRGRLE